MVQYLNELQGMQKSDIGNEKSDMIRGELEA